MTAESQKTLKAAQNMIERYGDNALKEVDLRIAELEAQGETEAHALWVEIRKSVEPFIGTSTSKTKH